MKELHFEYEMEITYSVPVILCHYTIKCFPTDTKRQQISNLMIEMTPHTKPQWETDSFGNRYIFGNNQGSHTTFKFRVTGDAKCGCSPSEESAGDNDEMIYRHSHGLNHAGETITRYYESLILTGGFEACRTPREAAQFITHVLNRDMIYEQGVTDVNTTAEEAFSSGRGVCQDYAHIMIALLHLHGCSARYVTGFLVGEGKSHAWVEVLENGEWYGFDPTNDMRVTCSHIRVGVGRDAADCMINRGIMHGGGNQTQLITVHVQEIDF